MNGIPLQIRVLGPPFVHYPDGTAVEGLGPGKPLAMLAYLLIKGEVLREELTALFWGDLPEEKARNAFRQTLHRLRRGLGEALVARGSSGIAIEPSASMSVDLAAFEDALLHRDFEGALKLYRGPFLEGLEVGGADFERWVIGERARLSARYQWALEQSISAANNAGDTQLALERAALLAGAAPLAPGPALGEAGLLIAAGRTQEARTGLEQFAQRYRAEFGEEPPAEIRESLARLRKDSSSSAATGFDAERRPLIGRDSEMTRLLAAWTGTQGGNSHLVLLEGPEGIGKTALVDEFAARISKLGPLLHLAGRERSSGGLLPYASIGQALRAVLSAPGLAGASQHLLAEAARLLPELHDQFDLPPVQDVNDEASQLRFYEGVAALLDAVAYEQPVCLVLDDFHNAAPATISLVEYLCGRLASVAIAIVLVFRPSAGSPERASRFPFGVRESAGGTNPSGVALPVTRISLGPLGSAEAELLARTVADEDVLPPGECGRIAALSGGVPFRILDLARQAAGGLRISALPATLQESLWARLQGCSPAQQRLFVAAALIERPASIKLLAGASHLSEAAALDAVLVLEARGLLRQTPQGVTPEHHEAAQLALMGTGPAGRALLAGWAAEAIAGEANPRPGELAHLFQLAGNNRECFKYSIAAAYEFAALNAQPSVKHFLAIAESAASTPADRSKIEMMRRAFEPEVRRLLSGEPGADTGTKPENETRTGKSGKDAVPPRTVMSATVRELLTTIFRSSLVRVTTSISLGVLLALAGLSAKRSRSRDFPTLPDTLFLIDRTAQSKQLFFVSGAIIPGKTVPSAYHKSVALTWKDSLVLPYMNPLPSPSGSLVAVERMRDSGPDILLFSESGKLLREAASGPGDDIIAGWSPDGKWLLATHGQTIADGSYDADLFAISADGDRRMALDTSKSRSVVEAAWSPDGTHIAWTARVGSTHQQDVFISNADGSGLINISKSPEEDYHIAWAPDGGRIAFTSNRFGNADIFAYELSTRKLLRLTGDSGQDDYAVFSPDGNFIAFESTAEGISGVYAVSTWGGNPFRVAGSERGLTIARWGNPPQANAYTSEVKIAGVQQIPLGRSTTVTVEAANVSSVRVPSPAVTWTNLDPALVDLTLPENRGEQWDTTATLTGIRPGLARIAISAGGWRSDTAVFRIGNSRMDLLDDGFSAGIARDRWVPVGDSSPAIVTVNGGKELSLRSGRQRENGVLSVARLPVYRGFFAQVLIRAPFHSPTAQRSFSLSLMTADSSATDSPVRDQSRLVTVQWIGQAARISYSVDRELWTEPVGTLSDRDQHLLEIRADENGKVVFALDGVERWKSRLRIPRGTVGRLWLGSQGAGDRVTFDDVHAGLASLPER